MKLLLFVAILSSHLLLTHACSCIPTTIRKAYYAPGTTYFVRATVIAVFNPCNPCTVADQFRNRLFVLRVVKVFKGCSVPSIVYASSPISSAACGVNLQKDEDYLLPLSGNSISQINSCQFIRHWIDLTAAELAFLHTRTICCHTVRGSVCKCVNGHPPVNCVVEPCRFSKPPCPEATKCKDNYCGGCFAEWFNSEHQPACH